jgi:hypothetical protein
MTIRDDLARAFHDTQSFKWDPIKGFTLSSGQTSPFYVDCRSLMAYPRSRRLVGHLAHDALAGVTIDCLGGLEIGAIRINERQGVRLAYVDLGNAKIELMEPARADSPVAKFLERNPHGGIHHFCLNVDDVEATAAAALNTDTRGRPLPP